MRGTDARMTARVGRNHARSARSSRAHRSVWTRSCTTRHRRTMPAGTTCPIARRAATGWTARNGLPTRRHLRHTSRPGHLRQPGSETVAGCADLGFVRTAYVPGRELRFGWLCSVGGAACRRLDGRASGTEARRRSAYPGHRRVRGAGANVRRRSGAHTPLGLASADTRCRRRVRRWRTRPSGRPGVCDLRRSP